MAIPHLNNGYWGEAPGPEYFARRFLMALETKDLSGYCTLILMAEGFSIGELETHSFAGVLSLTIIKTHKWKILEEE